jgi:hypothetical protein
MAAETRWIVG